MDAEGGRKFGGNAFVFDDLKLMVEEEGRRRGKRRGEEEVGVMILLLLPDGASFPLAFCFAGCDQIGKFRRQNYRYWTELGYMEVIR